MRIVFFAIIISIFLESTIITLPLTLLTFLLGTTLTKKNDLFAIAFFSGLFLDILSFRNIGWSSAYFTVFVLLIFLYQKKFEIETPHFIVIASFFGTLGYLLLQGVSQAILIAIISSLIVFLSLFVFQKTNKKVLKYA